MSPIFRLGLGGPLGDGRQWMPWVHVDDVVGLFLRAAATPELRGVVNAVAPEPVRNRSFTRALASALHRPAVLPVPRFGLGLMFGEKATILTASQRVLPRRAQELGYRFTHRNLEAALGAIFGPS